MNARVPRGTVLSTAGQCGSLLCGGVVVVGVEPGGWFVGVGFWHAVGP